MNIVSIPLCTDDVLIGLVLPLAMILFCSIYTGYLIGIFLGAMNR